MLEPYHENPGRTKLFVSVEPDTMTPEDRDYVRSWKNVTAVVVKGGHMVTEDSPDNVGQAIDNWFQESVSSVRT